LVEKAEATHLADGQIQTLIQLGRKIVTYLEQYESSRFGIGSNSDTWTSWRALFDSSDGISMLIPRSDILARMESVRDRPLSGKEMDQRARGIMSQVQHLPDIDAALLKLQPLGELHSGWTRIDYFGFVQANLLSFQLILRELSAGASVTPHLQEIVTNNSAAGDDLVSSLRTELLLVAIPQLLGTTRTYPVTAQDNAATYLHRVALAARGDRDWVLFGRTLTLTIDLSIDLPGVGPDCAAADLLLGGLNFERAHEYANAVHAYEAALKTGSMLLPAEFIGERLESLRAAHPTEFAQGAALSHLLPPRQFTSSIPRSAIYTRSVGTVTSLPPKGEIVVPGVSVRPSEEAPSQKTN
jgi:hypothetical protein